MKINFKSIHISNFMSIGEADIQLENKGYTVINGINNCIVDNALSNGSGKSALMESLVWCLTGETMRGNKDIVNCFSDDGTYVTLVFEVDNKEYKLIRSKGHTTYKTNLLIYINGEDKSGKGIRDSEKLLKDYLPDLTVSLIGSVIILGQGLPNRFTNNTPSGRKEVLEKLCKSDFMIEDLKQRISLRKTALQSDLRSSEDKVLSINTKLEINRKELINTQNLLTTYDTNVDYEVLIKSLQSEIDNNTVTLKKLNDEYYVIDTELNNISQQQNTLIQNKSSAEKYIEASYKQSVDELKTVLTNIDVNIRTLKNKITDIKNIKDICPTCGQNLPHVHKPDTVSLESELNKEESNKSLKLSKLNEITDKLNNDIKLSNESFSKQEIELTKHYKDTTSIKDNLKHEIDSLNSLLIKQNKDITTYRLESQNLQKNIEDCKRKINDINDSIKCNESDLLYNNSVIEDINERLSIISKFNTIVTRDFRGYLLQSVIEFINNKAKEYAQDIFETELIEFILDGNNISISYNGKQYEALSGGEKQKVDLIIQFSIRSMLCKYTNFSTNIITLDEIFDNLDVIGCNKVIDLLSRKLNDISSVFIISHHSNELSIPADNEITVVKNPSGISYIK